MRGLRQAALLAVMGAALMLTCFQVSNLDIGGHMAVGREILKSRAIPSVDFLSHTNAGHPYPVHQWLGEVALFAVDYLTGVNGLVALRMLVVLLGAVLLFRNARREEAPVAVAAGIVMLLLVAARPRFFLRPMLISFVFLPLLAGIVADVRKGRTRRLWPMLPLMAVWGHVHSGVLFGILFLLGTIAGEGLKILLGRRAVPGSMTFPGGALDGWNFRRLVVFSGIAIALPFATMAMVNPSGVKPLVLPLLFFQNQGFRSMILEYRAVDLLRDWPFDVVAGALLLGILLRPKRVDLTDLIVVTGFGILAFQAVRGILEFAAVSAPLLARTWGAVAEGGFARMSRRRTPAGASAVEAAALLGVIAVAVFFSVRAAGGWMYPFGPGKNPIHYPERALEFVDAQDIRGNVFNTDLWASSILWKWRARRHPVFVDARLEAYPEEFWRDEYYRVLEAAPGWKDVLDRRDVQWAIVRREAGQADDKIGRALWDDPGWGLAYWDDFVMVFVRRHGSSKHNDDVLATWAFTSFHPREAQRVRELTGGALVRAANELAQLAEWDPHAFLPRWALAAAWTRLGRGEEASALFHELAGRKESRNNRPFRKARAEAELVAGRRDRYEALMREAGVDPESAEERFARASLLATAGHTDEAIAAYRELLAADPGHGDALNNLALLLAREESRRAEAMTLVEEAVRRYPEDGYYLATRAEIRWRTGDAAGAREDFLRSLEHIPGDDTAARAEIGGWLAQIE